MSTTLMVPPIDSRFRRGVRELRELPRHDAQERTDVAVDLESELAYWRGHYRGLIDDVNLRYSDHEPAVKLGLDAYVRGHGRPFEEMVEELQVRYLRTRGLARLDWNEARVVVEAAWQRLFKRWESER